MIPAERMQILVVEDDPSYRYVLEAQLAGDDREVHVAAGVGEGIAFLKKHHVDLVLADMRLGERHRGGHEVLAASKEDDPSRPVVVITAFQKIDDAVEAMKLGALDYVTKPHDVAKLQLTVDTALRTRAQANLRATWDPSVADPAEGVELGVRSRSPKMVEVYEKIERVADTPTRVIITGETGTGKELVARALHARSRRRDRPFIAVNCGAIPRELVESELFGHEKGAFTSAGHWRPGRFEMASGGTLFLDEVGELPKEMQVKLLRVLQEGELERIGGTRTIRVDVRVIAATNRDLRRDIAAGVFREDLFYRLCSVEIALPALRDRREDIPPLCGHFIAKFNARMGKHVLGVDPDAQDRLVRHPWPGNIRELQNAVEGAVVLADGPRITVRNLPPEMRGEASTEATPAPEGARTAAAPRAAAEASEPQATAVDPSAGLKEQSKALLERFHRELIVRTLAQTGGKIGRAARLLKLSRRGLQLKMKELGLREPKREEPDADDGDEPLEPEEDPTSGEKKAR
jgi:DNA-binding NtrC family response regulator